MVNNVCLVGSLPLPVGGISIYCRRCIDGDLKNFYKEVVDFYPSNKKFFLNRDFKYYLSPFRLLPFRLLWLWRKVSFSSCEVIHFNFSSANFLLLASVFLKRKRKWILMLHNGELRSVGFFRNIIVKLALKKFDLVLSISKKQHDFYLSLDSSVNIMSLNSYLPPVIRKFNKCSNFDFIFDNYCNVVLGSGYGLEIYRFDLLIKYAVNNPLVGVVIILYGDSSSSVDAMLREADISLKNFFILGSVDEDTFLQILSTVSVYARPNDVDSFGIACADAVLLKTPVVASNVCDRFEGCIIFDAGDYLGFSNSINMCISVSNNSHDYDEKEIEYQISEKLNKYNEVYRYYATNSTKHI